MTPTHTREELLAELEELTQRLARIEQRKQNAGTADLQNREENAQYHGDDEVAEGLEEVTRQRIATIQITLGGS